MKRLRAYLSECCWLTILSVVFLTLVLLWVTACTDLPVRYEPPQPQPLQFEPIPMTLWEWPVA